MSFPGSEELIAAAEAELGRRLPEGHRRRLICDNGGEILVLDEVWTLFPAQDPGSRRTMARTASHIVRENEGLRRQLPDTWPPGLIAIGENGSGDYLVLSPADDVIRHWDHETGALTPVELDWA